MKDYLASAVRNVTVLGHSGAGKSSVIEACLYFTKAIDRYGKNNDGTTVLNFDPEEGKRGTSCYCHLAPVEWKDKKINFIDTPGYMDYEGEEVTGLTVGDNALIVVSAKDGVEAGTERAWKNAVLRRKLPTIFFVNKLDDDNADFSKTVDELREKFGKSVILFELPIIKDRKVIGSVNILRKKAWYYDKRDVAQEVPDELKDKVEEYYQELAEAIAMTDDELMEKFFSGEEFDQHELAKGLRIGVRSGDIRPVYCGSAELQTGIERLLDLITEYFPSYAEKGHVHALNAKGETIDMETNENEALSAFVFKTIIDPFVGKISYLKVMSGVLNSDSQVCNAQKDITEKVAQVYVVNGKYQLGVGKLFTGDIGCVVKLSQTQTNDTLCTLSKVVHYPPIDFPKPMLGYAIWPKTKADEDKMSVGIRNMCEEDHTIRLDKNAETHEQVLYGMGDQHIDLILSKLKSKYKVDVTTSVPTVQYRETIRGKAEAQGKYKKQNGGAGQYGDVWVRFEPCDSEEMVFAEEVFGGAVPKQYFPPTEQGLRDCMQHGPLAGFKVVGVKATLYDGSYHPVDSKEVAFKEAARLAYNAAMPKADPVLLEPICKVTTIAPEEYTGTLMGDFTKRRGLILDMQMNEDGDQVISAEVPMAEMLTYANELRSMTQGRGTYTLEFDRYQAAPKEVAEKVIAAQKAKNQK
ncbi:elongation factor G [Erysipelotrichaceae bacterium Oil+RF-744-GAM-WT-6]|jgi:elongation factor G|uniref:Elongation factor G n=1 Tax=Stecheria intestinalis TaxID=2606630 RepID=A0A7X2NQY3_9FIRM|nr:MULTISPECIES: elongation factor G [Erysipelotrichaceae]MCI2154944.1 elongation factor G [Solobacterium sp.]MSS57922.1 elongation factor G [Stecheria intestinalis]